MRLVSMIRSSSHFSNHQCASMDSTDSDSEPDLADDSESSEDEEVVLWRKAIRDSLERDLQLRVEERLSLDSAYLRLKKRMFPPRLRELRQSSCVTLRPYQGPYRCGPPAGSKDVSNEKCKSLEPVGGQRELAAIASKATTAMELPRTIAIDRQDPRSTSETSSSISHLTAKKMSRSIRGTAAPPFNDTTKFHWPEEIAITLPTPQHSYTMPANFEAMAFSRSGQLMVSQFCRRSGDDKRWTVPELVYDRNRNIMSPRQSPSPICLHFESRFESGNLLRAYRVASTEYDLVLQTDLYTKKHTQWFYFSISNVIQGMTYTFNLVNMKKSDSLYNYGMQPLLYSEEAMKQSGVGWSRVGHGIGYYRNLSNKYWTSGGDAAYFTLTWKMEFPYSNDLCYVAHCYPYTYSHLHQWLLRMEQDSRKWRHVDKQVLCKSLAGNDVFLLSITDKTASEQELSQRKGVILSARVHPGETNSSWMMQGAIEFLVSDHPIADNIRKSCIIKVVPMLNPDGVIVGNYRCSLARADLNRVYKHPVKELFPSVWHTKHMAESFLQEKGPKAIIAYVDLHGHSRKHNIFTYGCHLPGCNLEQLLEGRLLPWLLFQQSPDMFSFSSCKFNIHKCKESTGRVVMWRMGITNSFTLEATFCGTRLSTIPRHFTTDDYRNMGSDLCKVISNFADYKLSRTNLTSNLVSLALHLKSNSEETTSEVHLLPSSNFKSTDTDRFAGASECDLNGAQHSDRQPMDIIKNCRIEDLENESSTSGSDTSNDEFGTCSTHKRLQRRSRKKQTDSEGKKRKKRKVARLSKPIVSNSHTANSLPQVERAKKPPPSTLPATTSSNSTSISTIKIPHFVNRYANRSNGGIPMFSEERLQERKAKKAEISTVLSDTGSPHEPLVSSRESTSSQITPSTTTFQDTKFKSLSAKTPQLRCTFPVRKSYSANWEVHTTFTQPPSRSLTWSEVAAQRILDKTLPTHNNLLQSEDVTTLIDKYCQTRAVLETHHSQPKPKRLGHNLNISTNNHLQTLPTVYQWK